MTQISVYVSHGRPVVALGVVTTLQKVPGFEVRFAADGRADGVARGDVDVVVTDWRGAQDWASRPAPCAWPGRRPRILVLDESNGEARVRAALAAGVHGYLLIDCGLGELVDSVGLLCRGQKAFCPSVASRIADGMARAALTPREEDVLSRMVRGDSNKLIARHLGIAVGTVKAHAKGLFEKLGACSRSQAVAIANERGLLPGSTAGQRA